MLSEDVKINYTGFEPSTDMRSRLYYLLNKLHFRSPNQSFLDVTITLTNGIFEGVVKITSAAGQFVAKASDVQVSDLGQKLSEKALAQINNWKALRRF